MKSMPMTLETTPGFTVLSLLMPWVLLCLLAGCKTNQPIAAELQPLQGTWEGFMVDNEADGASCDAAARHDEAPAAHSRRGARSHRRDQQARGSPLRQALALPAFGHGRNP